MKYPFLIMVALVVRHVKIIGYSMVDKIRTVLLVKFWHITIGSNVLFSGSTIIQSHRCGAIVIGSNVRFVSRAALNHVGLVGETVLSCCDDGNISIGDNCGFSSVVIVSRIGITIGNNVLVGGNARIFDNDFHELDPIARRCSTPGGVIRSAKVEIEDDVFIGTNVIILKGTKIGARSIVAAGSVVFGLDIPPDSMVKGNPAVVVRHNMK